jgi:glycosyl transferase family 25
MFNTLIINLPHRLDRRIHVEGEVKKLNNLECYLIEAVIGGTEGCARSHRKCIEIAKSQNWNNVLILEDDVIFSENAQEIFDSSLEELNKIEWDMCFLGANLQKPACKHSAHLHKMLGSYAAHAYLVNSKFYDAILDLPLDKEIDVHYHNLMADNNVFLCSPMIASQLPSYSDLQGCVRDYTKEIEWNYAQFAEK